MPGRAPVNYRKQCLPNYRVFDEKRYFTPGTAPAVVEFAGLRLGLTICEDVWEPEPAQAARAAGAELLIAINASPYEQRKQREREGRAAPARRRHRAPGGVRESGRWPGRAGLRRPLCVIDARGAAVLRAPAFEESLLCIDARRDAAGVVEVVATAADPVAPELDPEESVYRALVLGVRDYVAKHRFPGVVMGLSGGVDSALTLTIAVDALGADRVQVVMMPSRYTSQISIDDAAAQARILGVAYSVISIEGMFEATLGALQEQFAGRKPDTTEENIQARCRGLLLMAISNKTGRMLLTTGNKSEMAVGYATLYGDMNGGFAPIKDCSKMLVYRLARYRNQLAQKRGEFAGQGAIPARVIEREPSAELRPTRRTPTRCRLMKCSTPFSRHSSKRIFRWTRSWRAASIAMWSGACSTWSSAMSTSAASRRRESASAAAPSAATGAIRSRTGISAEGLRHAGHRRYFEPLLPLHSFHQLPDFWPFSSDSPGKFSRNIFSTFCARSWYPSSL